jgi:hypothetical protein
MGEKMRKTWRKSRAQGERPSEGSFSMLRGFVMRRKSFLFFFEISLIGVILTLTAFTPCLASWDAGSEVNRLSREAPSPGAFPDTEGVVWFSSYKYSMAPDGSARKRHRYLITLTDAARREQNAVTLPYPFETDSSMEITEASWLDQPSGERRGSLESKMEDGSPKVIVPAEALEGIIAVETVTESDEKYNIDGLVALVGPLPVWEQIIEVEIPENMDFYWQGIGVRSPERSADLGVERIVWTIMNQPAWRSTVMRDEYPPTLVFSLRKGLSSYLRHLRDFENTFAAPQIPAEIASLRSGNLRRAVSDIAAYMSGRLMETGGTQIKPGEMEKTPESGPWKPWEGTLIAGKWLASMGYDVRVFWSQRFPVNRDGPDALALWKEPVLVIGGNGGQDVYFAASPTQERGNLPPSLYGASVYRLEGADVRRIVLPRGNASENTLIQQWNLFIDENGMAVGSLDLTVTGGWTHVLPEGKTPIQKTVSGVAGMISSSMPGMSLDLKSVRTAENGYRLAFGVRAPLGIVSGSDILMRMPGWLPLSLAEIPANREEFTFRFPFIFEQNVIVSTPKGYRSLALPPKARHGDAKAMVDESIVYSEKRSRIEASSRWIVRSAVIDPSLTGRIADQLALARSWTEMRIPLRK